MSAFDLAHDLGSQHQCAIEECETDNGPADYALCVHRVLMGIVEAKKLTLGPQNVLTQAERYSRGAANNPLYFDAFHVPFLYSTNGEVIWFHDVSHHLNRPGITKKESPLAEEHFAEFEKRYGDDPNGKSKRRDTGAEGRFRKFHIGEVKEREYKLDITWLKDESLEDADELPEPQDLAAEAIIELESVVDDLREMLTLHEQSA